MPTISFQHINLLEKIVGSSNRILTFILLLCFLSATAQNPKKSADSIINRSKIRSMVNRYSIENIVRKQEMDKHNKYFNGQKVRRQNEIFSQIDLEVQNAKFLLDRGFDYKEMTTGIHQLSDWEKFAMRGLAGDKTRVLTERNLSSTSILLNELLNRTNKRLQNIHIENQQLSKSQQKIDSLLADKNLYYVPIDSVSRETYRLQLEKVNKDINLVSARLKGAIDSIRRAEILRDRLKFKIESDIMQNDKLRKRETAELFTKKVTVFETPKGRKIKFDEPLRYSIRTNALVFYFYIINNRNSLITMLVLIVGVVLYFKLQYRKFIDLGYTDDMLIGVNILHRPVAAAVLVVLSFYQFVLPMPPLIFSILLWTTSTVALTLMMWKSISAFVWSIWLAIFFMNLIAFIDVIILVHVLGESYLILAINYFGVSMGIYAFFYRARFLRKFYLGYILVASVIQIFSSYYLITGHYNLAKVLMTKGVYLIAVTFSLFNAFIIAREISRVSDFLREADEDDPKSPIIISQEFSAVFYFVIFICCFLLMTRDTYTFQNLLDPVKIYISETRSIGSVSYSLLNVITFVLVILLSSFISKLVSFLASDEQVFKRKRKTKSIGSWIFLARITIVTIGVMIAFASAGIPLDKITLIVSALGVGIGFGMQKLINNLISGLIIAFEKPVSLGDVIEVGTQTGKMKSIGIRSSVVSMYNGADVVIPNGDLLDKNLTNWTHGNSTRRSEIKFGVAYGTDLELTKNLLYEILESNENVLSKPEPSIWFTNFGDYSIDVDVKYWISHFDLDGEIKSELIIAIDKTLKENNIYIPFPQHEVRVIRNPEDEVESGEKPSPQP